MRDDMATPRSKRSMEESLVEQDLRFRKYIDELPVSFEAKLPFLFTYTNSAELAERAPNK